MLLLALLVQDMVFNLFDHSLLVSYMVVHGLESFFNVIRFQARVLEGIQEPVGSCRSDRALRFNGGACGNLFFAGCNDFFAGLGSRFLWVQHRGAAAVNGLFLRFNLIGIDRKNWLVCGC